MGAANSGKDLKDRELRTEEPSYSVEVYHEDGTAYPDDGTELEKIIFHYELLVYQITTTLTGSESIAQAVVEEVFEKLHFECANFFDRSIEIKIHRYTYDAALKKLLNRIEDTAAEVDEFSSEFLIGSKYVQ